MEGGGSRGWWDLKLVNRVATALWSSGELAIRERRNFQRIYDLTERVIPECRRQIGLSEPQAIEQLLVLALKGHGWASTGTLAQTWRLTNQKKSITAALNRLVEKGEIVPCILAGDVKKKSPGWIRPNDLALTRCSGIADVSDNCLPLTRFWRFSNLRQSANMATTVFRCLPGISLWGELISKPIGQPKSSRCFQSCSKKVSFRQACMN